MLQSCWKTRGSAGADCSCAAAPTAGFSNRNPSLFLRASCSGVASAAPKLDGSLDAQGNQWKATHRKLWLE